MLKHPNQTEKRIRQTLARVESLIYSKKTTVRVEAWAVRGEPVSFEVASQADFLPVSVGCEWGGLWDTVWFRFSGTVPVEWRDEEVVALIRLANIQNGREGFAAEGLVYQDGLPVRAINTFRKEVDVSRSAKAGEAFAFLVEAAANGGTNEYGTPIREGLLEPDYNGQALYRLEQAELTCVNRKAFDLYFDFKVALEALEVFPENSQRRANLRAALNEAVNRFDSDDLDSIDNTREAIAGVLARKNGETVHRISIVGHAHIDTAWLWPLRETIRKCARTFATALDYMDLYPDYVFACSQAQQYAWMKAYYPTIWERIKAAIKRGQWEPVGSMWVEADCNLASGESLVRQILHGRRFFKEELDYITKDVWIPDVFGYSASLPQIMRKAGVEYFLTQKLAWSEFNVFPHHTFFWEGIDGSRIFTHVPPSNNYNADTGPAQLLQSVQNFKEHEHCSRSLISYGYGDGGGGPTVEMLEKINRLANFDGLPCVQSEKALSFFEKASAESDRLPVWVGELYLELHRGTYTAQARNKRGNRQSEFLLRNAEFWDAITSFLIPQREENVVDPERAVYDVGGFEFPPGHAAALDRAWKLVLLNQFHDIIPGSSIHWVYQDSLRDYETIRQLGQSVQNSALHAFDALIDTRSFRAPVRIVNTLSHDREEIIELPNGALSWVRVPACGYTVIEERDGDEPSKVEKVQIEPLNDGFRLRNGLVELEIDGNGALPRIHDLRCDRAVLSAQGNQFHLHEDIPTVWDAWDVEVYHREKYQVLAGVESVRILEDSPLRATIEVVRRFGQSRMTQKIQLRAGSARIDFVTEVEWRESQKLLKVCFPVEVRALNATYEIQYGHLQRPTHYNTSWDLARFEVCSHKWADLSEASYGVALLNDCKYGYDIHENVMRLSLLKASISPDPVADRGSHSFTYSIFPHEGDLQTGKVIEEAYALNVPMESARLAIHDGPLPAEKSWFSVDRQGVVIEAVKLAEDGYGLIVRLYEAHGGRGRVRFSSALPVHGVAIADLMESPIEPLRLEAGSVELFLKPFEIITLRLTM